MVRVLKDWAPEAQRLVRPGDMLYLPPRVAHHGVATAPGQTLSIGALAPRHEVWSHLISSHLVPARPIIHGVSLNAVQPNRLFGASGESWQSCPVGLSHTPLLSFSLSTIGVGDTAG